MARATAMFHLTTRFTNTGRTLDTRPFIGTTAEAFDELKEEFKEFFPDEFARKDKKFWSERYRELVLSDTLRTRVIGHDSIKGDRTIELERTTNFREEPE